MLRILLASVATAAAVLTAAVPAAAAVPADPAPYPHSPPRPGPRAKLTLTYLADAGYAAAVRLACEPTGGVHPQADQACATLAGTGGDPARIEPAPVLCTLQYAPVTARISGVWHGRAVRWSHRYGNGCEMRRATGVLFAF